MVATARGQRRRVLGGGLVRRVGHVRHGREVGVPRVRHGPVRVQGTIARIVQCVHPGAVMAFAPWFLARAR